MLWDTKLLLLLYCFILLEIKQNKTKIIKLFSFYSPLDAAEFKLSRTRQFKGTTAPTYAAIDETGDCVLVASPSSFQLVHDSAKEVVKKKKEEEDEKKGKQIVEQTENDPPQS